MTTEEDMEVQLERSQALNHLLVNTSKEQNEIIKHFEQLLIVIILAFTILISVMTVGFFWYESQFDETATTTTTLDTKGKNANINNVEGGDHINKRWQSLLVRHQRVKRANEIEEGICPPLLPVLFTMI